MPESDPDFDPLSDSPRTDSESYERSRFRSFTPLMRVGVIGVIASTIVMFLAAIAANNASPNSPAEMVASITHRVAMVAMLVAFCAILLSYRIAYLKNVLISPAGPRRPYPGYRILAAVNCAVIGLVWLGLRGLSPVAGPTGGTVILFLSIVYSGLLVTMVIWHNNYLKAYAVGALTAWAVMILTSPRGIILGLSFPAWQTLLPIAMASLTGLVCAGYVKLLEYANRPQPFRPHEKPSLYASPKEFVGTGRSDTDG